MPRNTAWEADYAQRLEAKRWQPVESWPSLPLMRASPPPGESGSLSSGFCIVQGQSRSFPPLGEG